MFGDAARPRLALVFGVCRPVPDLSPEDKPYSLSLPFQLESLEEDAVEEDAVGVKGMRKRSKGTHAAGYGS